MVKNWLENADTWYICNIILSLVFDFKLRVYFVKFLLFWIHFNLTFADSDFNKTWLRYIYLLKLALITFFLNLQSTRVILLNLNTFTSLSSLLFVCFLLFLRFLLSLQCVFKDVLSLIFWVSFGPWFWLPVIVVWILKWFVISWWLRCLFWGLKARSRTLVFGWPSLYRKLIRIRR